MYWCSTENTLPSIANWPKPPSRTARRSTPVTRWGRWRMQKTAPHSFISRYGRGTPSKTLHSGSDSAVCILGNPAYSPTRNQIPEFIAAVRRPPQRISFHCSTIPTVKTLQPVICKADFADASLTQQGQDAPVSPQYSVDSRSIMPLLTILAVVVCRAAGIRTELFIGAACQRGRTFPAYFPHSSLYSFSKVLLPGPCLIRCSGNPSGFLPFLKTHNSYLTVFKRL